MQRLAQREVRTDVGAEVFRSRVLEALASAANYRAWLCDLALPYLGAHPLEVGSGRGDHAEHWLDCGLARITVSEADPTRLAGLHARFANDDRVTVIGLDLSAAPRVRHDSLVAFNVLEHIADDVAALRSARGLVEPGGPVVLFTPAVPAAMSRFDRQLGHHRRYTAATLRAALVRARLIVERLDYVNAPGLAAWFLGMRVLRMTPREGTVMRAWDSFVVPAARAVEARVRPPIGQSLFAVARVPS